MRELLLLFTLCVYGVNLSAQRSLSLQNLPIPLDSLREILSEQYLYVSDDRIIYYASDGELAEVDIMSELDALDRAEIKTVWVRRSLKISGADLALTFENFEGNKVRYVFRREGINQFQMISSQIIRRYMRKDEIGD